MIGAFGQGAQRFGNLAGSQQDDQHDQEEAAKAQDEHDLGQGVNAGHQLVLGKKHSQGPAVGWQGRVDHPVAAFVDQAGEGGKAFFSGDHVTADFSDSGVFSGLGNAEDGFVHNQVDIGVGDKGAIAGDQKSVAGFADFQGRDDVAQPVEAQIDGNDAGKFPLSIPVSVKRD